MRGNLQTRLRKLDEGQFDALVLAAAGLKRLGLEGPHQPVFQPDEIIPAAGQGILAVQGRAGEDCPYLDGFADDDAWVCALCERAFVRELDGGCTSPVCAHAGSGGRKRHPAGAVLGPETGAVRTGTDEGSGGEAEAIGIRLARRLREGGVAE